MVVSPILFVAHLKSKVADKNNSHTSFIEDKRKALK